MVEQSYMSLGPHGFHKIAYWEWKKSTSGRTVICVHGLTRNGRDFDFIAQALESTNRVACPDLPGRGHSHWLIVPADYAPPIYLSDIASLIARLDVEEVDWIGTSLGGLLGILLAAQPNSPIRRLVVNDVGPFIGKESMQRIAEYVGKDPMFEDIDAAEQYLREVAAPFGPLTDDQWRHLATHSVRPSDDKRGLRFHYDPNIQVLFKEMAERDMDFWPFWDAISCPTLVLRGAESDVLLADTAREMLTRGPEAELVEFPGVGHCPMLMDEKQISVVKAFLDSP
jgi:pimeloyl-ACP methyl ester carboxylesterase